MNKNIVEIYGEIATKPTLNHECHGEKFYRAEVTTRRLSGVEDTFPVVFSEKIAITDSFEVGTPVFIKGKMSSKNIHNGEKTGLFVYVLCNKLEITDAVIIFDQNNYVDITGFLSKEPSYRETPYGRRIADIMIAVNDTCNRSYYIPAIVWGKNATYINRYPVGTEIGVYGRFQSRPYIKRVGDKQEERMAYELSVAGLEIITKEENE